MLQYSHCTWCALIDGHTQVENTLFRVHRFFFERESEDFIKNFANLQDGMSDEGPFRLEGITSTDFAMFLWVWYSP